MGIAFTFTLINLINNVITSLAYDNINKVKSRAIPVAGRKRTTGL
jgi:hypothetical protein